jgi:hypothetical protein
VLAAIGVSIKLATTTNPLENRVDELLARESKLADSSENLPSRVDDLAQAEADPKFGGLSPAKQRSVHERLAELKTVKSYQDFEKSLAEIPDPRSARTISQLKEISQRLGELEVPDNLPDSSKDAEAIQERSRRLQDARGLSDAAAQIRKQYSTILQAGNDVLTKKNDPDLPERIRKLFAEAKDLKTPENDNRKPLPGSDRLTYAMVFQLTEIKVLLDEWKKLKEKLEPAAKTPQG